MPVRELLASSSAELQSQMLGSIVKSDRKVLTRLAADLDCLRALDLWMIDLIPDTRAFQILEDILQVPCMIDSHHALLRLLGTHTIRGEDIMWVESCAADVPCQAFILYNNF